MGQDNQLAKVIYLARGEEIPDFGDDQRWLTVEASDDGRFFGTGSSFRSSGEGVHYISLPENDVTLEGALAAAQEWATKYAVPAIWVQQTP